MDRAVLIDVVIPSIRPNASNLSRIVSLEAPPQTSVRYYVVVDTDEPIDSMAQGLASRKNTTSIVNDRNRGAAFSRNRGFSAGSGDFVLFIDDDTEPDPDLIAAYRRAVDGNPDAPGFAGTTRFKPAINSFTSGMVASGIPDVWSMAETHATLAWGVTSNLLVRRSTAKDVRFSEVFPKGGGGEDIDYGLCLTSRCGRPLVSVPEAITIHDWWNGGRRQYRRLFRWAYGDSRLGQLHPEHRFYAPPNLVETLTVGLVVLGITIGAGFIDPLRVALWAGAMIFVDLAVEVVRLSGTGRKAGVRTSLEAAVIRCTNDLGRLVGNLRRGRLAGFMERFDYFCTRETVPHELRLATAKFFMFLAASIIVFVLR